MAEIIIGCGGWSYFQALGVDPLKLYSLAFRFVEVNSTFYNLPDVGTAASWRRRVPSSFEFSVKANRLITHKWRLTPSSQLIELLQRHLELCGILRSRIIVLEVPRRVHLKEIAVNLSKILDQIDLGDVRLAVEPRCGWAAGSAETIRALRDMGIIPVADYSKEDPPYDDDEIAYSRLFGRGEHNIYQLTDEDLTAIRERALKRRSKRIYLSFHGIAMYLDAARMEKFLKSGELPPATSKFGIDSLEEVLRDARFPAAKQELVRKHGWKLVDVDPRTRVPASVILKQLRRDMYNSLEEVIEELRRRFEKA
ncbi:MAG: DUF72 domain-containing protein [Nitrososphaerota archaeon]